ncbi:sulfite exporter TauE/SafE family protein [Marinobacter sp. M3C]|uniref:sulfite exporter TauE/SafE family protein n=1 Tax=unclassified Marinobacter TaxID=83889 RepID=UPI00200EE665|nr:MULTISPECIES: sulfite exporter TauE/SafE family protein [unclassified Marinobacter]MCL1483259.1 sulfite exporter TauE/SafE family protein [Marinobacter sp.]UQG54818.1 sulfite exporter TauE/SafE family protein [Marinobacter sp. M4C]UQG59810.1 sulfite exporter TauE/SafE family protein [Marinobacter sp. M3C]UQG63620.1 sulfite exporter TauE/SafE family protein [Marinobacter sp. M2C]UQG67903.1 sulfite exporter TauE/SafE family protein [Marinobacter sp. M1C]
MSDLSLIQYGLIALIFIWSGFVRSGLGFGGAVLSLPFLLLVKDAPLVFLPIIAVHLLVFSSLTIWMNNRRSQSQKGGNNSQTLTGFGPDAAATAPESKVESTVDWPYLWRMLRIMIVPKLIGVFGLFTLPANVLSSIIFVIVAIYSVSYVLNRPFRSNSKAVDVGLLMAGGYISGTSLIGAPLIIAVAAQHLPREKLRDTLFGLWFILVLIKLAAFIWVGLDLQLIHHLWLLPCAAIGHVIGLRFHDRILKAETPVFFRLLGVVLFIVSSVGIVSVLL